jgi:hypothetical protein
MSQNIEHRIGMVLLTTLVELRVVAGRCRLSKADANSHAMLMRRSCRAVPWPWKVALRTAWSWLARHGMCESNTATLCKSNGNDTI